MNYSSSSSSTQNHHPLEQQQSQQLQLQQQNQQTMDYSSYYYQQQQQQQQQYHPQSQSQYYSTANIYDYSSYYQNQNQNQNQNQEPNPPGVTSSSYYQYPLPVAPAAVINSGLHYQSVVHPQEIPQSQAQAQAHAGSRPNGFSSRPFRGRGRGRGSVRGRSGGRGRGQSLSRPVQDQTRVPMPQYPAPPVPPEFLRCEVCKIGCDTLEVLEQHKNGKKHLKNMKKISNGVQMEMPPCSNMPSVIPLHPNQVEENVNALGLAGQSLPLNIQGQPHSVLLPPKAVVCELCNVACNTPEIFEIHKNGKKHQKNLRAYGELQRKQSGTFVPAEQTSVTEPKNIGGPGDSQPKEESLSCETNNEGNKFDAEKQVAEETGPTGQESAVKVNVDTSEGKGNGTKRKMGGDNEGRRTKPFKGSKRPMDSSKPKEAVPLICELCNVRCETRAGFQSHLVGKKHQLKSKRYLTPHEILGQEILAALALTPALQGLLQQSAIASTSLGPPHYNQGFGPLGSLPGSSTQNLFNAEASASGANMENLSQPLSADNVAPHLENTEGKLNGVTPVYQPGDIYNPAGGLAQQTDHIASGPVNGAFELGKTGGFEPLPGPDATTMP